MTFQAQHQRGQRARTKIGALRGAYHGDTLGAVGVGELDNFMTALFAPLLLRCERLVVPADPRRLLSGGDASLALETGTAAVRAFFATHGASLAAFVCEPLVQGAGGMFMWPAELLVVIREECNRHDVYLIFDEVMTGVGRTGTFLACEQAGVVPDVLCLSKMLTGGVLPLAVTCATEALYDVFWGEPHEAFLHGHTYTANPIACAVAAESLALFEERDLLGHAARLADRLRSTWARIADHETIRDARTLGCIAAARIVDPQSGQAPPESARVGLGIHRRALALGLLVRPIGETLYLVPPLATPLERIDLAVETLLRSLSPSSAAD